MVLYLIGIGLGDEKDITLKGLEAVKKCSKAYLESYTSRLSIHNVHDAANYNIANYNIANLERLYGKKIILAGRDMVENMAEETILADAAIADVAFLVAGDVFGATTHVDLFLRAKERKIDVEIINNASIINAVGNTGLELYKFGRTTSVTHEKNWKPESPYNVIKENKSIGLHTLCLLDIKIEKAGSNEKFIEKFMTISQAIKYLLDIEKKRKENVFTENTLVVGCARLGSDDFIIKAGEAKELADFDFGKPLHCLIVPGKLHFKEEEMLKLWA